MRRRPSFARVDLNVLPPFGDASPLMPESPLTPHAEDVFVGYGRCEAHELNGGAADAADSDWTSDAFSSQEGDEPGYLGDASSSASMPITLADATYLKQLANFGHVSFIPPATRGRAFPLSLEYGDIAEPSLFFLRVTPERERILEQRRGDLAVDILLATLAVMRLRLHGVSYGTLEADADAPAPPPVDTIAFHMQTNFGRRMVASVYHKEFERVEPDDVHAMLDDALPCADPASVIGLTCPYQVLAAWTTRLKRFVVPVVYVLTPKDAYGRLSTLFNAGTPRRRDFAQYFWAQFASRLDEVRPDTVDAALDEYTLNEDAVVRKFAVMTTEMLPKRKREMHLQMAARAEALLRPDADATPTPPQVRARIDAEPFRVPLDASPDLAARVARTTYHGDTVRSLVHLMVDAWHMCREPAASADARGIAHALLHVIACRHGFFLVPLPASRARRRAPPPPAAPPRWLTPMGEPADALSPGETVRTPARRRDADERSPSDSDEERRVRVRHSRGGKVAPRRQKDAPSSPEPAPPHALVGPTVVVRVEHLGLPGFNLRGAVDIVPLPPAQSHAQRYLDTFGAIDPSPPADDAALPQAFARPTPDALHVLDSLSRQADSPPILFASHAEEISFLPDLRLATSVPGTPGKYLEALIADRESGRLTHHLDLLSAAADLSSPLTAVPGAAPALDRSELREDVDAGARPRTPIPDAPASHSVPKSDEVWWEPAFGHKTLSPPLRRPSGGSPDLLSVELEPDSPSWRPAYPRSRRVLKFASSDEELRRTTGADADATPGDLGVAPLSPASEAADDVATPSPAPATCALGPLFAARLAAHDAASWRRACAHGPSFAFRLVLDVLLAHLRILDPEPLLLWSLARLPNRCTADEFAAAYVSLRWPNRTTRLAMPRAIDGACGMPFGAAFHAAVQRGPRSVLCLRAAAVDARTLAGTYRAGDTRYTTCGAIAFSDRGLFAAVAAGACWGVYRNDLVASLCACHDAPSLPADADVLYFLRAMP